MSDLIDRQAAIDALGEKPLVWDDLSDFDLGKAAQWSDDVDAIKELPSAQPQACDDAISREDAKWVVFCNRDHVEDQTNAIDSLPCVQSPHIKGRWVGTDYDGFADGNPVYDEWKCSECGCVVEDEEPTWNYCPNCGAKMEVEDEQ